MRCSILSKRFFFLLAALFFAMGELESQSIKQIVETISIGFQKRDFRQVIITGDSVLATLSKDKRSEQKNYAFISFLTGSAYLETGQLEKAGRLLQVAYELYKQYDKRSEIFGVVCNNLGRVYMQTTQFNMAVTLLKESLEVSKSMSGNYNEKQFPAYMNLSYAYKEMGRIADAESILLELKKNITAGNPAHQLFLNSSLVSIYSDMGEFEKAESGISDMLAFAKDNFGNESREYAKTSMVASKYYYIIKDYNRAEQLADNAITILKKNPGVDESEMPAVLTNLAYIYYFTGRNEKADSLFSQNMQWFETNASQSAPLYTMNGNGRSLTLISQGKAEDAITLLQKMLSVQEELKNEQSSIYAALLVNLSIAYNSAKQTEKTEAIMLRSFQITEQLYGKDHPEYQHSCFNMAAMYWDINRPKEAMQYFQLGMSSFRSQLQQIFSYSSEKEKLNFMQTISYERNKYYSFLYQAGEMGTTGNLYDYNLFSKGLLLNSLKQINADIVNSSDPDAGKIYDAWQKTKKELAYWYSKPIADRKINIDSLKLQAEKEEKQLVRISSAFRKNQESGNADWKTIQKGLKPGEAAIEFTAFYYFDKSRFTDSVLYAALILKKDSELPEQVMLFEKKQLDSLMKAETSNNRNKVNQFYDNSHFSLYDLVWSAIDKKLENIHTVYFSPTGLLHKISFAALPVKENILLSDKYHLVELNSTKGLLDLLSQKITPDDSLVLYGGIAYDADSSKLKSIAGYSNPAVMNTTPGIFSNTEEISWNYLPFTKTEVEEIEKTGSANHYKISVITDEYATEESLKSLNGKRSPAVLHIASHGFFFPDPKEKNAVNSQQVFKYSDDPLLRSGLFFAGAYYTWAKGKPITGIEDGIATAYEIANMYLPNTKLCVLSACETGLGDIYGSEGVLGLQRAFRIAGVKYLVMSLWKVPDTETAEFMTIFYKAIFKQQSIPDAFYAAQTLMKEKYRDDPYKWAAFILVR